MKYKLQIALMLPHALLCTIMKLLIVKLDSFCTWMHSHPVG